MLIEMISQLPPFFEREGICRLPSTSFGVAQSVLSNWKLS